MAKERHRDDNSNDDDVEEEHLDEAPPKHQSKPDSGSESDYSDSTRKRSRKKSSRTRSRSSRDETSDSWSESDSGSGSESEYSSEERRRRRKRRERRKREEKERERSKRRRKDKEKRKRKRDEEKEEKRNDKEKRSKKKKKEKEKEKEKEKGKIGAVTNLWGKYGIIRETDMWNKRPEFTAWLLEVKKINLESLPNWEEKQMFKEFMEDHNTATFPSKKYYNLDAYYKHKMEKEMKKGLKKVPQTERTVFDDEEQRRYALPFASFVFLDVMENLKYLEQT